MRLWGLSWADRRRHGTLNGRAGDSHSRTQELEDPPRVPRESQQLLACWNSRIRVPHHDIPKEQNQRNAYDQRETFFALYTDRIDPFSIIIYIHTLYIYSFELKKTIIFYFSFFFYVRQMVKIVFISVIIKLVTDIFQGGINYFYLFESLPKLFFSPN